MVADAVIFVGPSLGKRRPRIAGVEERPPIKRGDLTEIDQAQIVGIVDGEFHQSVAVSPREILGLLRRGVTVLGSSSMGALRAAELSGCGMEGVGRIFEMYRDEEVTSDDEVAVLFDPATDRALSEPMVNVRCSVDGAVLGGLITSAEGEVIVETAAALPYPDRSYRWILRLAGEKLGRDLSFVADALRRRDQKRDDALSLYDRVGAILARPVEAWT